VSTVAVLRNPTAGRGRHRDGVTAALRALAEAGHVVKTIDATTRDEAAAATRRAVQDGIDALVVIGGDGTVHIGLQAVAGTDVGLGVVPTGTGNDFARALGVPLDLAAAGRTIARALDEGRRTTIDLARITPGSTAGPDLPAGPGGPSWWFGAVLAAGFDALVNERANAMRWPKGRRRYDLAVLAELISMDQRHYRITLDDAVLEQPACLVAVGNTPSYGGGLRMCPDAQPTDGLLDVIVADPVSRLTLIRLYPRVFQGTHVRHPAVRTYRTRSVTIETLPRPSGGRRSRDGDVIVGYADGERIRPLPLTITAVPAALHVLV
jgi:Sphingosine kinase and enzymes related to eukaryotic diacylglycerol kinase